MKKKIVIAIVLVILLVGIGVGSCVLLQNDEDQTSIDLDNVYAGNEYPNNENVTGEYPDNGELIGEGQNGDANTNDVADLPQTPFNPDLPISSDNWPEHLPRHIPGSVTLQPVEDLIIGTSNPLHRRVYYIIDGRMAALVDPDDFRRWSREVWEIESDEFGYLMALMHFVEYFNISREDFEATLEEMREDNEWREQELGRDLSLETYELPNADIIFTFNPEIISYFYRRE